MRTTKRSTQRRPLRALTMTLVLTLLAALLLAGTALAAAKPGRPTAKAPTGSIATTKPTFNWSKAKGASKYELRVYQGSALLLKKTGLKKTSHEAVKALPTNVTLTWKVRAANAAGAGAWSRSLTFKIVPANPAKVITAFSFASPAATGVINEAAHIIALTVPYGTDVSALVPTIAISGAAVSPASGVAHDFANPVTYTVTAADATTQTYVVTVTVAAGPHALGDVYGGGKVAYILEPGDLGYSPTVQHGLIAATADQTPSGSGIMWARPDYQSVFIPGGTEFWIGTGAANTDKIVAQNGAGNTYAAGLARSYNGGGYSDWYLPSRDELNKLYLNSGWIGGLATEPYWIYYWSSSEYDANNAWMQKFNMGSQGDDNKPYSGRVRAVRAF